MHTNPQQIEKLNYLAAGLIAAAGIHSLLCILSLPALASIPAAGLTEIAVKSLRMAWAFAGAAGGVAVGFHAFYMINGRSYRKARVAAVGALFLPLLGTMGAVTAFPLLPVAIMSLALLFSAKWKTVFADSWAGGAITQSL